MPARAMTALGIDATAKLRHLLQTVAFCLAISALQVWMSPVDKPYEVPLVYSLAIGCCMWAGVDFGRHLLPSAAETGWPPGWPGLALQVSGIVAGFVVGTWLGDRWFGWSSWDAGRARAQLRGSIVVTVLACIVGCTYFYSAGRSAWLQRNMAEARQHAGEARLKLLEAQLEPHMLFNTLANLRALIGTDPPRAERMLDHLIAYLRATLDASRATTHPLSTEFERLRDYLELMAVRMGPRLAYTLDLPEALAGQPVPTLLLQPLVENGIGHGLEPRVGGGRITVAARRHGGELVLEVIDSGVGVAATGASIHPPGSASAGGFGLVQVRERLATVYGSAASLVIGPRAAEGEGESGGEDRGRRIGIGIRDNDGQGEGTCARIVLPLTPRVMPS